MAFEGLSDKLQRAFKKLTGKGKEILQDQKGRLKRALDAGVEAYKEEKAKTT